MILREGFPAGWSSDHEDSLELLLKSWLTSTEVAELPAWQWGNTARQGPSFRLFWSEQEWAIPSAIWDFSQVSSNSSGTVGWSRRKHMLCFCSFHKRLLCLLCGIENYRDEWWKLHFGLFYILSVPLRVMVFDFSLLLYLERGVGRRWVLVLWVMTQKHQKESLFSFLFGILLGPAVFRKSSYSTTGT